MAASPTEEARTPGMKGSMHSMSRLLWPLYLFFVIWIVLPVYATIIAGLLPLSDADIDRFLQVVIVMAAVLAWWSGYRGGPLLLSEAQVLLGLSGQSRRPARVAVVRQALFVGGFVGMAAAWLTAMAAGGDPDWVISAERTLVGIEIGVCVVGLAVLWNVDGRWWVDRSAALALSALLASLAFYGDTIESLDGPLGLLALVTLVLAAYRAPDVRVDRLWQRSLVLAELQYGAALLDFRSALASLRTSRDGPRIPRGGSGKRRLPLWLWRPVRSLAGSPALVLVRVLAMIGGVALFLVVLKDTTARLAALAGVLAIGAVDLTAPLASIVGKPLLFRSTRIPVRVTLLTEALVGIGLTLAAGIVGWLIISGLPGESHAPEVIAVALAAGGASTMQARLGSPDLGGIIEKYGAQRVPTALATRAAAPVLALLLTVSGVVSLTKHWNPTLAAFLTGGWVLIIMLITNPESDV